MNEEEINVQDDLEDAFRYGDIPPSLCLAKNATHLFELYGYDKRVGALNPVQRKIMYTPEDEMVMLIGNVMRANNEADAKV